MIKMGKDDKEEEHPLTIEDKNKLLLIDNIIRMNSDYTSEILEKADIPTLEALYESERLRENSKKKTPEPTFIKAPIKHTPATTKIDKKENTDPDSDEFKFNALEVFKPQYIHPSRLKNSRWDENSEILTMRVNANPKHPEWQVS